MSARARKLRQATTPRPVRKPIDQSSREGNAEGEGNGNGNGNGVGQPSSSSSPIPPSSSGNQNSTGSSKMVMIETSDGVIFNLDRKSANTSNRIKNVLGKRSDSNRDDPVPLPEVHSSIFERIKIWMDHHKRDAPTLADNVDAARNMIISPWDSEFINTDHEGLSDILIAAHYLDIRPLIQLGCRTVADQLRGVPLDQLRKMANVPGDLSQEEQTQMRREIMKSWEQHLK